MIIYLIGFMGSGKTTIGEKLQEQLQMEYTDTDEYIEKMTGRTIPDIFALEGEKAFRTYETNALKEITSGVVSTGGGIVETAENISFMKDNGVVVYLPTSLNVIENRLHDDQSRPLWKQPAAARAALFARRSLLYESTADITVETDHKTVEEISAEVVSLLGNRPVQDCQ
ncbi:shikimate kinase [Virgibacillus halophilus]|uniref:Shikimate kinase n=1 Tax=Tigheibacillus halophilus TaxID=361280 RepID=A0ABU5CCT6_9BACI|nr:shikimate kinase [Virgibacillus halophilus]